MEYKSLAKLVLALLILLVAACGQEPDTDESLQQQVTDAIAAIPDLPADTLIVTSEGGRVHVSGSLECEDCGGMLTPAGKGTIQQTLGAVIRAVPGVESVQFELQE